MPGAVTIAASAGGYLHRLAAIVAAFVRDWIKRTLLALNMLCGFKSRGPSPHDADTLKRARWRRPASPDPGTMLREKSCVRLTRRRRGSGRRTPWRDPPPPLCPRSTADCRLSRATSGKTKQLSRSNPKRSLRLSSPKADRRLHATRFSCHFRSCRSFEKLAAARCAR